MSDTQPLPEPLAAGSHGAYRWLASRHDLENLLKLCPNVVLGKYLAVTSIDSSYLSPSAEETSAGWESRRGIAYSPLVQSVEMLPRRGWDEWYVFAHPTDLGVSRLNSNILDPALKAGEVGVFVNYGFAFHPPERASLANLFWNQLDHIQPESYISDNDYLTFVTRDESLFASVTEALAHQAT
jgi:hypothetical protein